MYNKTSSNLLTIKLLTPKQSVTLVDKTLFGIILFLAQVRS